MVHGVNIAMTIVVERLKAMFPIDVLNTLIGKISMCLYPQISCLKLTASVVRTVTILAMALQGATRMVGLAWIPRWGLWWLLCRYFVFSSFMVMVRGSFLDSILSMGQAYLDQSDQQRALDAQWQFTLQTYGLHRPSRDGFLQTFRAVSSYIGPGNPAILAVPVSTSAVAEDRWRQISGVKGSAQEAEVLQHEADRLANLYWDYVRSV